MKNKNMNDYYYFSFKKLISSQKGNKDNISTNFDMDLIKSFKKEENNAYEKLRKIFIFYITQKLSKCFILILNKLNLFNFIKILSQRINKNINQFVFYFVFYKNDINTDINRENKIFFFEAIKTQIKANLEMDENNINEISILLRTNIPKFFMADFSKNFIPYINPRQEKNLINSQLFLYNNEKLINYIIYFFEKEKQEKINDKIKAQYKKYIKNDLNLHKLKNKNIFGITKYINRLKQNFKLYPKLQLMMNKESFHSENIEDDNFNDDELEEEKSIKNDNNQIDIKNFMTKFYYMNNNN